MPALEWLTDPAAAAVAHGEPFEVEQFLRERGTLYLLGEDDSTLTPLVTAFTGHLAREARRLAAAQRGGRLDPPLTMLLDEAALICPIPLARWTADMGGRNITIHIAAQSRAQLRQRWGDTGAAAIMNNAAMVLIYGGTRDPGDLAAYSTITGEQVEQVRTFDGHGRVVSGTHRRMPVLTPGQIAQLPAGQGIAVRRGLRPVIGVAPMAWERRDVQDATRSRIAAVLHPQDCPPGSNEMSTPEEIGAALAAIGRDLETHRRRLDALADVRTQVHDLAVIVRNVAESGASAPPRPARTRSWLGWRRLGEGPPDSDATGAVLRDLAAWISGVYLQYGDAADSVPDCWLWHPDVVEELLILRQTWTAAYAASGTATTAADWHERLRPGVVRRLRATAATCSHPSPSRASGGHGRGSQRRGRHIPRRVRGRAGLWRPGRHGRALSRHH